MKLCILLLLMAAAAGVPACAQDASGADTFKNRCAMCHGTDGLGQTPAGKIFKAASLKAPMVTSKSNQELHAIVKNGRNKMPPVARGWSDEQVRSLVAYLKQKVYKGTSSGG